MSSPSHLVLTFATLSLFVSISLGAAVVGEKREMPSNQGSYGGGGGYSGYDAGYAQQQATPQQQVPAYASQPQQQQQYGGGAGATPPYGNPGFSVQTGFEGFLVPNSMFGMAPWGMEGVVVAIAAVIVFIVIAVGIVGLVAWLTGFGDYALVKESARSLIPTSINFETLTDITNTVLDALDKYDQIQVEKKAK